MKSIDLDQDIEPDVAEVERTAEILRTVYLDEALTTAKFLETELLTLFSKRVREFLEAGVDA